jgi:hypothetical protein
MLVITDEARDAIRAIIDGVIREGGVVVFLDPTAAELLDDKILDAHAHGDHVHFSLDEQ